MALDSPPYPPNFPPLHSVLASRFIMCVLREWEMCLFMCIFIHPTTMLTKKLFTFEMLLHNGSLTDTSFWLYFHSWFLPIFVSAILCWNSLCQSEPCRKCLPTQVKMAAKEWVPTLFPSLGLEHTTAHQHILHFHYSSLELENSRTLQMIGREFG